MDESLKQAIEAVKEQQPVSIDLDWYQGTIKLPDIKQFIRANINSASRCFVAIGYYLKYIRDKELYQEDGYQSIWELAQVEFGISKSQASKFMSINDRFSVDGNSPILQERYREFSSSKLSEMLYLTDEQLEQVTVGTTVAQIREIKKPDKVVSTSKQEPEQRWPRICKWDGKSNCVAMCTTGAECCSECEKHGHCNSECGWQNERVPKPSGKCVHRPEFPCTLPEAAKTTRGNGVDCNNKCCWNCLKHGICGLECNSSFHRPVENNQQVIVDKEPEIANDVDETVIKTVETVINDPESVVKDYQSHCDDCKYYQDGAGDKRCRHCYSDELKYEPIESEQVETVEADIIQPEPEEEVKQGVTYSLNAVYLLIQKARAEYDEAAKVSDAPKNIVEKRLIIRDALLDYYQELRGRDTAWYQKPQPELPILRNNDQRKDFVDAYETWPIWIDQELTGEKYYRYDFDNGDSMVVKVYYCKVFDYKSTNLTYEERFRDDWGKEEYYLLEPDKYFKDCETNKSALVDYLKEIQKKGV